MSDLKPPRMPNAHAPTEPSADTTTTTVPAVEPNGSTVPVQQPIAEQVPVVSPVAPVAQPVAEGLSAAVESTGNAVLDVAVNAFVSMTGCTDADISRALDKAAQYQDENLIDVAFLKERFGKNSEQAIALAKAVLQQNIATAKAEASAAQAAVVEVAGSREQWDSAVGVFNAHADADTKRMVKVLLDNGLFKQGATQLMQFVSTSGLVPNTQGNLIKGSSAGSGNGLSLVEFNTELQALKKEANGRSLEAEPYASRYNNLMQRRAIGRAAGK